MYTLKPSKNDHHIQFELAIIITLSNYDEHAGAEKLLLIYMHKNASLPIYTINGMFIPRCVTNFEKQAL